MSAALVARDVVVEVGETRILDGVDLSVDAGEVVALVGPNGAGKSTLLAALSGDAALAAGQVELFGRPVADHRPMEAARRRAVLQQRHSVAFGFRAVEVVAMGRAPWARTPRADDDDRAIAAALRAAQVEHLAHRAVTSLSGGEQARTAFARVLAQSTEVLLLDEPTAALDIRHQEALLATAQEVATAGGAVVVVLHDLSLAAAWADRICLLERGAVRADGPPAEVLTESLLTLVYRHPVRVHHLDGVPVVVPLRAPLAVRPPVRSAPRALPIDQVIP